MARQKRNTFLKDGPDVENVNRKVIAELRLPSGELVTLYAPEADLIEVLTDIQRNRVGVLGDPQQYVFRVIRQVVQHCSNFDARALTNDTSAVVAATLSLWPTEDVTFACLKGYLCRILKEFHRQLIQINFTLELALNPHPELAEAAMAHGSEAAEADLKWVFPPDEPDEHAGPPEIRTPAAEASPLTTEEKMMVLFSRDLRSVDRTAQEWADLLQCSKAAIIKTKTWKACMQDREQRKKAHRRDGSSW